MSNLTIFDLMHKNYKITKPIRLIELFAGIGSQAKALENLGVKFEHYKVCEFNKYSITSYNAIHGTNFETSDITKLKGEDLEITDTDKYCYIMTYSFPCQDLSLAGKRRGMEKGKGTRSGLLWEVERLLKELGSNLPQVLVMENVPQVIKSNGWFEWCFFLEKLGYKNYCQILCAKNYGIPQNRERAFMISVLGNYTYEFPKGFELKIRFRDMFESNIEEKYYLSDSKIKNISNWKTYQDPLKNIDKEKIICPTLTARGAGEEHSGMILINEEVEFKNEKEPLYRKLCNTLIEKDLLKQDDVILHSYSNNRLNNGIENMKKTANKDRKMFPTLTTRSDRFGVVVNEPKKDILQNKRIRKITPLECWRLMGFSDEDFYKAKEALNNAFKNGQDKSNSQLYMQAGNSIVVSVLMAIFAKLLDLEYETIIKSIYRRYKNGKSN